MELISSIFIILAALFLLALTFLVIKFAVFFVVKIVTSVAVFWLVSTAVFYALSPVLNQNIVFDRHHLWLGALMIGTIAIIAVRAQHVRSFRQYGTIAVVTNFLMVTLPIWLFYESTLEQVTFLQNVLKIEPLASPTIGANGIFFSYWLSINLSTFLFYGWDKQIALIFPKESKTDEELGIVQTFGRNVAHLAPFIRPPRVPERVLHWHSFCGGSLGAFIAQKFFRHKSTKESFRAIYHRTVLIQIFFLVAVFFFNQFLTAD